MKEEEEEENREGLVPEVDLEGEGPVVLPVETEDVEVDIIGLAAETGIIEGITIEGIKEELRGLPVEALVGNTVAIDIENISL